MNQLRIALPALPGAELPNYRNALTRLGAGYAMTNDPDTLEACDGLLLPGGYDADPALYGQENTDCDGVNRALDDLQLEALRRFTDMKKPVLGVCRGHQMINIFFGGSLHQNLPTWPTHRWDDVTDEDRAHMTTADAGSFLDRLYGTRFAVNSAHHQGIDRLGAGLIVVQHADDGVIESVIHESLPLWAVQWHPERMCFAHARPDTVDGSKVLQMFLEECQRRM